LSNRNAKWRAGRLRAFFLDLSRQSPLEFAEFFRDFGDLADPPSL
jgi:hypothetical protein